MSGRHVGVLSGLLVGCLMTATLFGAAAPLSARGPEVSQVGTPSLNWRFWDFFNVPYGEIWDYRFIKYGDLPINAECFNQTAINDGACVVSNPSIPDTVTYPYTNWYPSPGATFGDNILTPGDPNNNPLIYAPYRFSVQALNIPGYNRSEPVFLPVFKYAAPPGNRLDFEWNMDYVTRAEQAALRAVGCGPAVTAMDGFIIRSQVTLTMDLAQSKRMFDVGDTGTFSPTTNPGIQGWASASNGRSSDNLYATSSTADAISTYGTYGIVPQTVGGSSPILQVEIGLEGKTAGDDDVRVEFSTDAGLTWTPAGTVNLGTTDSTTYFDVTALRAWTSTLLNNVNFRTRIVYVAMGTASVNSVDWVPVRVKADAGIWWAANALPTCPRYGAIEIAVEDWFQRMGRTKYDITNSYEFDYSPFYTQISATVDLSTGVTTVTIDHESFGTEVLLARWFYWGNASYAANHLDSTKRAGWWGMELAWFEDFRFVGSLDPAAMDFTVSSVMQYHFQQLSLPGPNGIYDRTDDVPIWTWGPILSDYTDDWSPVYTLSELDRYPAPPYSYVHSTPGSPATYYGLARPYEYVPLAWDLDADEAWRFEFPTGIVVFWDPNLTPSGAHPRRAEYVSFSAPLGFLSTRPAGYGTWDATAYTWTVTGPTATGGPPGSPGPDRTPGTGDDQYALAPWGSISFRPDNAIRVSIQAPWTQLYPDQPMDLTVTASVGNTPLAEAAVTATLTGAGSITPSSGPTDPSTGKFKTTVRGSTSGTTITVGASVSKSGYITGTASYAINIVDPLTMTMAVSSNRREMMGREVATIRASLTSGTTGVTGALLTPSTPIPGSTFSSVRELGSGNYEFDWTAPLVVRQTFVPINVLGKAGGYFDTTGRVTILVDPNKTNPTDPTQLFLLVRAPATSLRAGQSMTVTVYAYTIEGFVVSGATVTLLRVGPGSVSTVSDRLNGEYTFTYTAPPSVPGPTGVLITITAAKFGYANGTARLALTVVP